ncbi:MAG: hypothetical protein LBU58_09840 [Clostridiales bacterium]|nr:hypothetical protein [Clostridiales bacterium]
MKDAVGRIGASTGIAASSGRTGYAERIGPAGQPRKSSMPRGSGGLPGAFRGLIVDSSGSAASENDVFNIPSETLRLATVILAMLPILVIYPFVQKYFVKGVMLGSVKG